MRKLFLAIVFLVMPVLSSADDHTAIVEFWKCELKDGATMEAVEANNKKWLAATRKAAGSDDVNSYLMTTIVGDQTAFWFADAYPDMSAWSAANEEMSDELKAIEATFEELMDCSDNRLYKSTKH